MFLRAEHPLNDPRVVRVEGKVTSARAVQPLNGEYNVVTPSGIISDVSEVQSEKVLPCTTVNWAGNVTCANAEHPENALLPIVSTPSGITIAVNAVHWLNALSPMVLSVLGS